MRVSAGVLKFLPNPIPTLVSRNHEGVKVLYVPRSTIFKDGGFTDVYFCVISIELMNGLGTRLGICLPRSYGPGPGDEARGNTC